MLWRIITGLELKYDGPKQGESEGKEGLSELILRVDAVKSLPEGGKEVDQEEERASRSLFLV